jgi:hypothetical protein
VHSDGAAPSQKKYSLSVAVTDSLGGLTAAPLMLQFAGRPLLPVADRHVTIAGLDNCIWTGCILPSLSVVEVIVCDDEACLLHPKNMSREIMSRNKRRMVFSSAIFFSCGLERHNGTLVNAIFTIQVQHHLLPA